MNTSLSSQTDKIDYNFHANKNVETDKSDFFDNNKKGLRMKIRRQSVIDNEKIKHIPSKTIKFG
jgi:hypothetical protein